MGDPVLPNLSGTVSVATLRWNYLGQNSAQFPTRGLAIRSSASYFFQSPGAATGFAQAEARAVYAHPLTSRDILLFSGGGGTTFSKEAPPFQKFALGGSGVFVGWAVLDQLSRCPVKIDNVLASYGTIHVVTPGALMERTTNYTFLRDGESGAAYKFLSQVEPRTARRIAYGAISALGTKFTFTDLVLQRPAIKTILQKPAHALGNRDWYLREREFFAAKHADVYYGEFPHVVDLPEEEKLTGTAIAIDPVSRASILGIAEIARRKHYRAMLYIAPVSDLAWAKLDPAIFARTEDFIALAQGNGIEALNRAWSLPIDHFGDPSHVNSRGRAAVMADLMPRLKAHLDLPKTQAAP